MRTFDWFLIYSAPIGGLCAVLGLGGIGLSALDGDVSEAATIALVAGGATFLLSTGGLWLRTKLGADPLRMAVRHMEHGA